MAESSDDPTIMKRRPRGPGGMDGGDKMRGGGEEGLESEVGGDVGLTRIFRGIGKTVRGDGLKSVAGVAAQMAVIDDQRRAILIADSRGDLHDLGIRPP